MSTTPHSTHRSGSSREDRHEKPKEKYKDDSVFGITPVVSSSQKRNPTAHQYQLDTEKWEFDRLRSAGVIAGQEVDTDDFEETVERVELIVKDVRPQFLKDYRIGDKTQATVSIVRDPTSDIVKSAQNGSLLVQQMRLEKERQKNSAKPWKIEAGTTLGSIMGVKEISEDEIPDETEEEADWRKKSQFGSLIKSTARTDMSADASFARIQDQRKSLPIFNERDALLRIINDNQVTIIVGETGSGKTTQITQYLLETGHGQFGIIGCTQPRRVAAVSVARRVADERRCELGSEVGYAIRFEDQTSKDTKIKYMTEGVLLRETLTDSLLNKYSVIMMDEAHERSVNTDVLFGLMRRILPKRRDLKFIVTSATMNADRFSQFFGNAPIYTIPGRTFPVDIFHTKQNVPDYVAAASLEAVRIHYNAGEENGDILVFLPGQEDIICCCDDIRKKLEQQPQEKKRDMLILPIYSLLPSEQQARIFDPAPLRKCIVATNIAETSLTVDGIKYVVDAGFCKLKVYNPRIGMDTLQVTPISKANALQRSGRAGRTGPGQCFRLYTEHTFECDLLENTVPEVQRTNLGHIVLLLKSLGISDILSFDFMDPPPSDNIINSLHQLWMMQALDNDGNLTKLGRKMVEFPLDPPLSKMICFSEELGCGSEIVTIVSMLSVPTVFYRPKDKEEEADTAREKFFTDKSDHLTLLTVYEEWMKHRCSRDWCNKNYIHFKAMERVKDIRSQLVEICQQAKVRLKSCHEDYPLIRKCICASYFVQAARMKGFNEYINIRTGVPCFVHPTSALNGLESMSDYLVYHELVLTSKEFMQCVTPVDGAWLAELGPMFFGIKESYDVRKKRRLEGKEDPTELPPPRSLEGTEPVGNMWSRKPQRRSQPLMEMKKVSNSIAVGAHGYENRDYEEDKSSQSVGLNRSMSVQHHPMAPTPVLAPNTPLSSTLRSNSGMRSAKVMARTPSQGTTPHRAGWSVGKQSGNVGVIDGNKKKLLLSLDPSQIRKLASAKK
ncbi:putative Pre-mRNA-splicing factor ATP-dependent RNA helicase PRP16 [Blattamonas nauphoetae]|uniref:RNA helicase n=1 Tax=Blattamonas nauphoetae TaxID=2049346 RepID=A0ABQ9XS63_9EUKA|nr:putative Pre-mRNA-splicing factor ATP-dependent RNA helicase PRP16 [Blattamonas nauphoetae]